MQTRCVISGGLHYCQWSILWCFIIQEHTSPLLIIWYETTMISVMHDHEKEQFALIVWLSTICADLMVLKLIWPSSDSLIHVRNKWVMQISPPPWQKWQKKCIHEHLFNTSLCSEMADPSFQALKILRKSFLTSPFEMGRAWPSMAKTVITKNLVFIFSRLNSTLL